MVAETNNPSSLNLRLHQPDGEMKCRATIYTIGYEQSTLDAFLSLLLNAEVHVVVDVRELPLSRKKGFSKNQLREALSDAGIEYVHIQSLGAPRPLRHRLREDGDWETYAAGYTEALDERDDDVLRLVQEAMERRLCLLCYERDPDACHRSLVAERMEKFTPEHFSFQIEHIRY